MRPHIDHVRACDAAIQRQLQKNRHSRGAGWLQLVSPWREGALEPAFGPLQAQEHGRYARVYLECGSIEIANTLLKSVEAYLLRRVGPHHDLTHLVRHARFQTLFVMTLWNEAAEVLRQVYESQRLTLGESHR